MLRSKQVPNAKSIMGPSNDLVTRRSASWEQLGRYSHDLVPMWATKLTKEGGTRGFAEGWCLSIWSPPTYEGKPTKDQPPKFSHCNPPFVAGRDPQRGKKQSQARDVLVPQEVTPTLLRMSQFRDWASAGHRHYHKLRIFLLSFGKIFDHQRLFGPLHMDWWTMVDHAMPHRNSPLEPFCATQQHRKVPALVTVAPSFIPHWIVFVGAKHPRDPSIKTIAATSKAGTWKWKQPWNLADLKGWNMSSNMWQVTCVCAWLWHVLAALQRGSGWLSRFWHTQCWLSSHGTSLIAALRHCGCSGPHTYLEGVY